MVQSKRLQNNKISSKIHTKGTMSKINNTINRKTTIKNKFQNAEGNANRQEHQLQYMYTQNFDALLINLVTPSSAASVLNETANHDIPVILFNREADKKDLSISKQTWYVGTAAKKAGAIQADMLQNVWNTDKINLDRNKNNKLDYILIEGEQTHFDAVRRTNGFLENSQNLPLNQLTNLSADWQRNLASVKFSKLDTRALSNLQKPLSAIMMTWHLEFTITINSIISNSPLFSELITVQR